MPRFKDTFFAFSSPIAKVLLSKTLFDFSNVKIIFPFYHAISDFPPAHIHNLYTVRNVGQFIKDADYLLLRCSAVSLIDLIEITQGIKTS